DGEFRLVEFGLDRLRMEATADASVLSQFQTGPSLLRRAITLLETTYFIRLFAEFETGLRVAWRRAFGRTSQPQTARLLAAVAARCRVPDQWLADVDAVRQYRNALVHESDDQVDPISIEVASGRLCRFFSRLPDNW